MTNAIQECIKSYEKQLFAYRQENERLKEALESIVDYIDPLSAHNAFYVMRDIARAALEPKPTSPPPNPEEGDIDEMYFIK